MSANIKETKYKAELEARRNRRLCEAVQEWWRYPDVDHQVCAYLHGAAMAVLMRDIPLFQELCFLRHVKHEIERAR